MQKPEEDKKPKLQSTSDYKYMCDQCGHQAHRPNQLDVHKYSKHNIPYDPSKYQVITCQVRLVFFFFLINILLDLVSSTTILICLFVLGLTSLLKHLRSYHDGACL